MVNLYVSRDVLTVLVSVAVQVPLAVFLGHAYDQTTFMDAGYLVSAGLNPYQSHLVTVFSPYLVGVNPIIGDPPLWPLLLGAIYRLSYGIVPNIFLYNFATKIPVIAANLGLAYLTKSLLRRQGASEKKIKFAWIFLLFNPFLLLTTAAWGQFDTLIAVLCISSLYLLSEGKIKGSAILFALSAVLKPISLPLIGLPILFASKQSWRKTVIYILISAAVIVALWILPFVPLGWTMPSSGTQLASYFTRAGGMTPFSLVELFRDTVTIPTGLELLGYIWIPALILGYYIVYRDPPKTFNELTQKAIGIMLIFFLTYSWLSEPYVNVVIALALLALPFTKINFRNFHFLWVITLVFMIFTTNFFQLFYLVSPQSLVGTAIQIEHNVRDWRLIARFLTVVAWQFFAWMLAIKILLVKKFKMQINETV
jgi:Gpi18-like mannosyltransferase